MLMRFNTHFEVPNYCDYLCLVSFLNSLDSHFSEGFIIVNPLAFQFFGYLIFNENLCFSLCGVLNTVSRLTSHHSRCLITVSLLAFHFSGCLIIIVPLPLSFYEELKTVIKGISILLDAQSNLTLKMSISI